MKPFLTAEWRKLAVANYSVDPALLQKYLPYKTELDLHNNTCYVSLVGFMFLNTGVKGFKIPFHINFEEVNLRFYVKYKDETNQIKRGVVFIKEIVPKPALAFVANFLYHENYITLPMNHLWQHKQDALHVSYQWKTSQWNMFTMDAHTLPKPIQAGSEEEFIFEHYWGYTKVNQEKTYEYQVEHPVWQVYPVRNYHIDVKFGELYGSDYAILETMEPSSVFLAEGSEISVLDKKII